MMAVLLIINYIKIEKYIKPLVDACRIIRIYIAHNYSYGNSKKHKDASFHTYEQQCQLFVKYHYPNLATPNSTW